MKVKIAHCSDIHLGFKNFSLGVRASEIISEEIKNSMKNILRLCQIEKVEFLLISGDLFDDTCISSRDVEWIIHEFKKYNDYKIIISPGNHDPFTDDSPYKRYDWPLNVYIFKDNKIEKLEFEEKNLVIWGGAFTNSHESSGILKGISIKDDNKINICVIHGDIKTSESSEYNPIYLSDIQNSNLDYLALGHIHKKSDILKLGSTYYSYPGNPQSISFNEIGDKGIYVGYVGNNFCDMKFEKIGNRNFELLDVDISDCKYSDEISDKIFNSIKENFGETFDKNLYKISLVGDISEDTFINKAVLYSNLEEKIFYIKIFDNTKIKIDEEKLKLRNDFKSMFIKSMLLKIKNSSSDEELESNKLALKIGLKSLEGVVKYIDN